MEICGGSCVCERMVRMIKIDSIFFLRKRDLWGKSLEYQGLNSTAHRRYIGIVTLPSALAFKQGAATRWRLARRMLYNTLHSADDPNCEANNRIIFRKGIYSEVRLWGGVIGGGNYDILG